MRNPEMLEALSALAAEKGISLDTGTSVAV